MLLHLQWEGSSKGLGFRSLLPTLVGRFWGTGGVQCRAGVGALAKMHAHSLRAAVQNAYPLRISEGRPILQHDICIEGALRRGGLLLPGLASAYALLASLSSVLAVRGRPHAAARTFGKAANSTAGPP